jgi:hypothetical protein
MPQAPWPLVAKAKYGAPSKKRLQASWPLSDKPAGADTFGG